ncbi:MAG: type II CAAX endopeptidase family protein [Bryobacteraceae bacterium]
MMNENEVTPQPAEVTTTSEASPFWNYQDLVLFLTSGLPALLAGSLIVKAVFYGLSIAGKSPAAELIAAQFLSWGLWFVVLHMILRVKYGRPFWESLGWVRPFENVGKYALAGILLAFCLAIAGMFMKAPNIDMPMMKLLSDRTSLLLIGIAAATVGPLCEELAFRGFLLPLLVRSTGAVFGIILTALPFALLHGPQYGWSWRHILFIVVAGASFGWMRYRTGSTAAATIMHAAYNLTFFVASLFQSKPPLTQ